MNKLFEFVKNAFSPAIALALLAVGFTAKADVQLSYSINGSPAIVCATGTDAQGVVGVICPTVTVGSVTVIGPSILDNWPGSTNANEFASTIQITNTSTTTSATVVLWFSAQNFTHPIAPPGMITWSNEQSLDGTTGTTTANSVGCVDQTNALAPPTTANFCSSGIMLTNTPQTITGASAANSNVQTTLASLSPPYSFSSQITLTVGPGVSMHVQDSQILQASLTLACASSSGQVGTPYSSSLSATGGFPPYFFTITSGSLPPGLSLNGSTGAITGTPATPGTFNFTAQVQDSSGNSGSNTVTANCTIVITPPPTPLALSCASGTGQVGVAYSSSLIATGGVPPYTFSIISGTLPNGLTLSASTGAITGTPTTPGTFNFTAQVIDSSGAPGSNTVTMNCSIVVAPPPLTLTCPASTGQVGVAYSSALVASGGVPPYTYSIISGSLPTGLTLNPSTGAITGTPTTPGTFNFTAQAVDSSGNQASNTITSNCSIVIAPNPPTANCVTITAVAGNPITPVTMMGGGGVGGPYTFTATGLPPGLTMSSGGTISGTPTTSGTYNYTVTVRDSAGNTGTVNCSVTVLPAPTANCVTITAVVGNPITPVTMVGSGGVGGPYTFTATGLPPGLTMSSSGTISGTPTTSGTYNYTVTVKDSAGNTGTVNCSVTVAPQPTANCVTITAVAGNPITPVTMVGSGGVGGPYTFTATGLPPGITISSSGTISGTPTTSGTFNYTVTVTDSGGNTGTVNCSVTVNGPPTATCVTITAVAGNPITPVTMVGSGGVGGPYTFTATGLPPGITISTSGTISGTPTTSGNFNYTVTVKDSAGNTGTVNCSVTVNGPPTATCVTITAVAGNPITPVTMVGSGGVGGPYTFTATGLPPGITMSSSGTISGTPTTSGTFNYTVTVKDSAGNTGTVNCSVTVNGPPTATCVTITAVSGNPITPVTMVGSGGVGGPYTFTATGLPPGITMSSSGTISGTPTTSGTFNYTVTVKDSAGNTGTVNCSVTVLPAPTATCVTITAVAGTPITPVTMVGSGGVGGPYTFTATGLPPGITISSSGAISGTPTASGTFNYTVTVKDSAGNTGTVNCSVTVGSAPPPSLSIVKTASNYTPTAGAAVTYTYKVTNTSSVTVTNITVTDDNGTPGNPADDFTVGTIASLAPGASATFTKTLTPSTVAPAPSTISPSATESFGGISVPTGFTILGLGGDSSHPNAGINCSAATVGGNIGIASDFGTFTNNAPCVYNGSFYRGTNVTLKGTALTAPIVTASSLMNSLRAMALNATTQLAALTPTMTPATFNNGSIGSNLTVNGAPGLNVVDLNSFSLTGGTLTLNGVPGTQFVININGAFNLHSGNIVVTGGMSPMGVIYNITNPTASVTTMVPTTAVGILLAYYNSATAMDSSHFYGEMIAGYNQTLTLISATKPSLPVAVTNTANAIVNNVVFATTTATVYVEF